MEKCDYLKSRGHENSLPKDQARKLTLAEMKALRSGDHVFTEATCGHLLQVKVNGQPTIWKRSPEKVRVPYKYGLYDYGYLQENDAVFVPKGE